MIYIGDLISSIDNPRTTGNDPITRAIQPIVGRLSRCVV